MFPRRLILYLHPSIHPYNAPPHHHNIHTHMHNSVPSLAMEVSLQLLVSAIIGMFCGLLNARIFKAQPSLRHFPIHQTALVMLFGYLAYAAAEAFGVSGILTLFIAAVTQAHYAWHSLSKSAQVRGWVEGARMKRSAYALPKGGGYGAFLLSILFSVCTF